MRLFFCCYLTIAAAFAGVFRWPTHAVKLSVYDVASGTGAHTAYLYRGRFAVAMAPGTCASVDTPCATHFGGALKECPNRL